MILSNQTIGLFKRLPDSSSPDFRPRKSSFPTLVVQLTGLLLAALLPLLTEGLSASHNPQREVSAYINRLTDVSELDQDVADHDHDGESSRGDYGSHSHGHSTIDHSHESLFALPQHATSFCAGATSWRYCAGTGRTGTFVAVPERPPRPATA